MKYIYNTTSTPWKSFCSITGECRLLFAQSYINAYETAFNQSRRNYQKALNRYSSFTYGSVDGNFIYGTFGHAEQYNDNNNPLNSLIIDYLRDDLKVYVGTPYLFISVGSGSGPGFMYLNWIVVTYGVPYVVAIS